MHASLRRAQRAIAVLFFTLGFGYANWLARIPAVREQLGLDDRELGLTLLSAGLGALVAFRMTTALVRRHGTRRIGALGSVAYGLLMALPAMAPSGPWAAAALFVAGWFNGLMDVGLNAQAVNIERRLGRPILAALHGAFSLGAFAGASFGAAAAALNWPVAVHLALVGILLSAVSYVATRALLVDAPAPPEPAVRLRLPRALWLLGAVAFCASVGEGAMAEWSGIYLRDVLHTTLGAAASGYTAFSLAMVTGRLCGDGLVHRFAPARTLVTCGLVAAASLGIGLCLPSPGGFAAASLGVGAGLSLVIPLVLRAATALQGINEATALSVVATLGYGGYLLGPPVLGVVAHSYGMRAALATVVLALLGLSALATRLRPALDKVLASRATTPMPKRPHDQARPLQIHPHFLAHPEGSALVVLGETQVICTASVEEKVPGWMFGKGRGWVSAEYEMLPRATHSRSPRASLRGKVGGRTHEISRLIGRSLRQAVDMAALGERCITVDCDVLQADGGTRTAAITGGYVALALAIATLHARKPFARSPLVGEVAAISVGQLAQGLQLDLDYALDSQAVVDMNVVMTGRGELVEVQGSGEQRSFSRQTMDQMLDLAFGALDGIVAIQRAAVATPYHHALTQRAPAVVPAATSTAAP